MALSLVVVPLLTRLMGTDTYGVWVILFQLVGYFSLLDLGLGSAVVRFVSRHLEPRDDAAINRVLNTSNLLYVGLGILALLAAWLFSSGVDTFFNLNEELADQAAAALIVLGGYLMVRFWLLPFGGSLEAFQRTDIDRWLGFSEDLVRAALLVTALYLGGNLLHLAVIVFGVSLIRQLTGVLLTRRVFPALSLNPGRVDRDTARELLRYSRISLGITLCWVVLLNTDGPLLGAMVSAGAAGVYRAGAQVVHQLRLVLHGIGGPLIPAVSQLSAQSDPSQIRTIYLKGLRYLSWLTFAVCAGMVVYAHDFVALWLPPDFGEAATVLMLLAVGAAFSLPQTIGEAVLFGVSKHSWLLRFLAVEAVARVILAVLLVQQYGLTGMAVAATATQVVLYVVLYPIIIRRALGVPLLATLRGLLFPGLPAAVVVGATATILRLMIPSDSWPGLAGNVVIVGLIAVGVGWKWVVSAKDRLY
jgi:O-antigen/teichoic acid export membrane protein